LVGGEQFPNVDQCLFKENDAGGPELEESTNADFRELEAENEELSIYEG